LISPRPGSATRLSARLTGAALTVAWHRQSGPADGYDVRLDVRDGASRLIHVGPSASSTMFTSALGRGDSATLTVSAIGIDGRPGSAARLTVHVNGAGRIAPNPQGGHHEKHKWSRASAARTRPVVAKPSSP
jgi:hypothetical protein